MPTWGANESFVAVGDPPACVRVLDLGGGPRIRGIWPRYLPEAHGVVFVVDAAARPGRDAEVRAELDRLAAQRAVAGKPLLLLAHKSDAPGARSARDVAAALGLCACTEGKAADDNVDGARPTPPTASALAPRVLSNLKWADGAPCSSRATTATSTLGVARLATDLGWLLSAVDATPGNLRERVEREASEARVEDERRRLALCEARARAKDNAPPNEGENEPSTNDRVCLTSTVNAVSEKQPAEEWTADNDAVIPVPPLRLLRTQSPSRNSQASRLSSTPPPGERTATDDSFHGFSALNLEAGATDGRVASHMETDRQRSSLFIEETNDPDARPTEQSRMVNSTRTGMGSTSSLGAGLTDAMRSVMGGIIPSSWRTSKRGTGEEATRSSNMQSSGDKSASAHLGAEAARSKHRKRPALQGGGLLTLAGDPNRSSDGDRRRRRAREARRRMAGRKNTRSQEEGEDNSTVTGAPPVQSDVGVTTGTNKFLMEGDNL